MSLVLRPLAEVFRRVAALRNTLYDRKIFSSYRSNLPVVSIGNMTVGGTGKTPLTLFLATKLKEHGFTPVILTRGYKGKVRGPYLVDETKDLSSAVGDEPLLMAQSKIAPVVVSRNRSAGAKFIESQKLGNVILLDDGMQHRRLHRDVEIVAIDCSSDAAVAAFERGELMPEGRFRESRDRALSRCSIAVLNHRRPQKGSVDASAVKRLIPSSMPQFESFIVVDSVKERSSGLDLPPGASLVALCALANPEGFFRTVDSLEREVRERIPARDHASFSPDFLRAVARRNQGSVLICSAKDAVKLPSTPDIPVYVLKTKLSIVGAEALLAEVLARLKGS